MKIVAMAKALKVLIFDSLFRYLRCVYASPEYICMTIDPCYSFQNLFELELEPSSNLDLLSGFAEQFFNSMFIYTVYKWYFYICTFNHAHHNFTAAVICYSNDRSSDLSLMTSQILNEELHSSNQIVLDESEKKTERRKSSK